jgi:predicted GH43/DUF377 family glycosyl hydrolase
VIKRGGRFYLWYAGRSGLKTSIGHAVSPDGRAWRRHGHNPVLESEASDDWAVSQLNKPMVLPENRGYRMWYTGFDWRTWSIGHAVSPDGVRWEKRPAGPVLTARPVTDWDAHHVVSPWVVPTPDGYRMWYTGICGDQSRIGMALSENGVQWAPAAHNPVLAPTTQGWDSLRMDLPRVLFHEGVYRMWYSGYDGFQWRIGHAASADGLTWERHADPVLAGTPGAWDGSGVWGACVLWDGRRFLMWYTGTRHGQSFPDGRTIGLLRDAHIGLATSEDGLHWIKQGTKPILTKGSTPSVLTFGGVYRMWYTHIPSDRIVDTHQIRYATSTDGLFWRVHPNHPFTTSNMALEYEAQYRVAVLLCGDHYRFWYDTDGIGGNHRHIGGLQTIAQDVARITATPGRAVAVKHHGVWSEVSLDVAFENRGPGAAAAVEATLIETDPGVKNLSPHAKILLGDLKPGQSVRSPEPLRLLLQGVEQEDPAPLPLRWQMAYRDTVTGDRQTYETE